MNEKNDITERLTDFINSLNSDQVCRAIKFVDDNCSEDKFFINLRDLSIARQNEVNKKTTDYIS